MLFIAQRNDVIIFDRVVVGILDAFHFDVSEAKSVSMEKGGREEEGEVEREDVVMGTEMDSSCEDVTVEGERGEREEEMEEEREEMEEERGERKEMEEERGEREEMDEEEKEESHVFIQSSQQQQKIHDTIVQSILPRLNSILTKVYMHVH